MLDHTESVSNVTVAVAYQSWLPRHNNPNKDERMSLQAHLYSENQETQSITFNCGKPAKKVVGYNVDLN